MVACIDFDVIYGTDLVYVPGCWRLCGDAHCCSFRRYKERFKLLGRTPGQELPLLPGEYDYLSRKGYLAQFQDHEHRAVPYQFGDRKIMIETILSRREGCACDHSTRTTICRLYPVLPVFDIDGGLVDIDRVGIYDLLEEMDGYERICKVETLPVSELKKLLTVTREIAREPRALFYISAYKLAHDYVRERLVTLRGKQTVTFFKVFENSLLRNSLIEKDVLTDRLTALANAYEARWEADFVLP